MSMPITVNVPGTGLGVLWRAKVTAVDDSTTTIATFVDCPALARGCTIGPLPTLVPGLAVGEMVLIGCLGLSRQDMAVLARWSPRWPAITEVPGLGDALAGAATADELARALDRIDGLDVTADGFRSRLWEIQTQLGRTTSKVEEFPDALARQRAERIAVTDALAAADTTNAQAATSALRAALYGASTPTATQQCELRLNQDVALAAGTEYIISTLWSTFRDTEATAGRTAMVTLGTSDANPTRVRIPADGDYDVLYSLRTDQTSGTFTGKVLLNADATQTIAARRAAASVFSDVVGGTGVEGAVFRLRDTGRFAAGDLLTFTLLSSVAFNLTAVYYTNVRSRIRVIRRPT